MCRRSERETYPYKIFLQHLNMSGRKRPGKKRTNYGKKTRDLFKSICEDIGREELGGSKVHEIIRNRSKISDNKIKEHLD